uniref:Snake toxin/toxin-like domain-containing protein n=1 Tax=Sinocyclocheilus rhinocerous TaxID=307959 RepID=A0A673FHX4_9TELE
MLLSTNTDNRCLSLSVSLCFITKGHSLRCYECLPGSCADQNVTTCPSGFSKCPIKVSIKIKLCVPTCEAGTQQLPTGGTITTQCCDTDLCNAAGIVLYMIDFPTVT